MSPLQPYVEVWDAGIRIVHGTALRRRVHSRGQENHGYSLKVNDSEWRYLIMQDFLKDLLRKGAQSETDMSEMPVCRQDIGDSELPHNCHRRKIGERYSRLVGELLPQFNRSGKSVLGDFLYVNEW